MTLNVPMFHIKAGFCEDTPKDVSFAETQYFKYDTRNCSVVEVSCSLGEGKKLMDMLTEMARLMALPCAITVRHHEGLNSPERDTSFELVSVYMPFRLDKKYVDTTMQVMKVNPSLSVVGFVGMNEFFQSFAEEAK